MNAMMSHRGPDDDGSYLDPCGVALGARRLSIIDVEGGHQPVSNEDGTVWAVLNGEIYNHPALFAQLLAGGHELRSRTDTEVLVHLYEELRRRARRTRSRGCTHSRSGTRGAAASARRVIASARSRCSTGRRRQG